MSYYDRTKTEEYLLSLLDGKLSINLEDVRKMARREETPIVSDTGAQFLVQMVKLTNPKRILEIGTAIGYSGLLMLLSSNAQLYTIDFNERALQLAKENFDKYAVSSRVRILPGDASLVIPMIEGSFDFIFLDGPKGRYYEYLPYLKKMMRPGAVLLADNVLYSGRMSGEESVPRSKQTIADRLDIFIKEITTDSDFITSIIPVGDGMCLAVRK
ncbi:MAG: O-methyltransferase [Clostridia bacterium]|nr:O-methyltransferase [Clostridia bacterium]MBP5648462.1 O-methyltransferase [Clostridia bacterium]